MYDDDDSPNDKLSKTAKKKNLLGIQQLADALAELTDGELKRIPFEPELRTELEMARKLGANSARRRQLRFVSRLLNEADLPEIRKAYAAIKSGKSQETQKFHELEVFRDRLLSGGAEVIADIVARFPNADPNELAQLQTQAQREKIQGLPPKAARAIFQYLRKV